MIHFNNVYKNYEQVAAIQGISIKVNSGELFGLIGPDGAGKTTLIRILTTLLLADKGSVSFAGKDVVEDYKYVRNNVGYMPGTFSLYQDLTVEENLHFFASSFGTTIKENYHLIEPIYVQLEPFKNRKAGALSGGMKQKLALCCALIHKPEVLVLDEPTTGVDAVSRKEFWAMLKNLKEGGLTIFVSTPYMDEAEMCDRVALIQDGVIMDTDTPEAITAKFNQTLLALYGKYQQSTINLLHSLKSVKNAFPFGDSIHITLQSGASLNEIKEQLENNGVLVDKLKPIDPIIEDCFMDLMTND
ncbi:MAG: ABC transporter ATP-binding protein [Cyclobacteriaceae bacterium]|nr:ABC transporter ATP-binding protein [Cyclobacteriaceae bacterium]